MSEQAPITWAEVVAAIAYPWGQLSAGLRRTSKVLLRPDDHAIDMTAERAYMDAFGRLYLHAETALEQINVLRVRLTADRPAPPDRPVEIVMAEIEAEGHPDIRLTRDPAGQWRCETTVGAGDYGPPFSGENWRAWAEVVEHGVGSGATPAAAADARLAQIRELHRAKIALDELAGEDARREAAASEEAEPVDDEIHAPPLPRDDDEGGEQ
jgi:hypothetical protein